MSAYRLRRISPSALRFDFSAPVRVTAALADTSRWGLSIVGGGAVEVQAVGYTANARAVSSVVLWTGLTPFQALLQGAPSLSGLIRDSDGGSFSSPGTLRAEDSAGGHASLRRYRWLEIQGIPENYPAGYTVPWSPDGGVDPGRASRSAPRVTIPGEYFAAEGISMLGATLDLQRGRTGSVETLNVKLVDLDGRLCKLFATQDPDAKQMVLSSRIEKTEASLTVTATTRWGTTLADSFANNDYAFCRAATLKLTSRATTGGAQEYIYTAATGQAGSDRMQLTEGTPITGCPGYFAGRLIRLWEVDLALSATPKCLFAGMMDEPSSEDLISWSVRAQDMAAYWNKRTLAERLAVVQLRTSPNTASVQAAQGTYALARERVGEGTTDADPKTAINTDLMRIDQLRGWDEFPQADCTTSRGYNPAAVGAAPAHWTWILSPSGPRVFRQVAIDQEVLGTLSEGGGIRRDVDPLLGDWLTVNAAASPTTIPDEPWTEATEGHVAKPGTLEVILRLGRRFPFGEDGGTPPDFDSLGASLLRILSSTGAGTNGDHDLLPDSQGLAIEEDDIDADSFAVASGRAFGYMCIDDDGGIFDQLAERLAHPAGYWLLHTRDGRVLLRGLQDLLEHESPEWNLTPAEVLYDPHPTLQVETSETFNAVAWDYDEKWLTSGDVVAPPILAAPEGQDRITDSSTFSFKSPLVKSISYLQIALTQLRLVAQASEIYSITVPVVLDSGVDFRDVDLGDVVAVGGVPVPTRKGVRTLGTEADPVRLLCVGTQYNPNREQVTLALSNAIQGALRSRGFAFSGRLIAADTRYLYIDRSVSDGLHTAESVASATPVGMSVADELRVRFAGAASSPSDSLATLLAVSSLNSPARWRLDFGASGVLAAWFHAIVATSTASVVKIAGDHTPAGTGRFWAGVKILTNDANGTSVAGYTVASVAYTGGNTELTLSDVLAGAPTAGSWVWPADTMVEGDAYSGSTTAQRRFAHFATGDWVQVDSGRAWVHAPIRPEVSGDPRAVTPWV